MREFSFDHTVLTKEKTLRRDSHPPRPARQHRQHFDVLLLVLLVRAARRSNPPTSNESQNFNMATNKKLSISIVSDII